jgi:ribonuclease BN (tRNA processing enzyme)
LKLTVLGCHSPFPGPGGATSGYLLETSKGKLLLDCGSGVISQLQKYMPLKELDAILISHLHEDHISDIGVVHYAFALFQRLGERQTPLPIYIPTRTPTSLAKRVSYKQGVDVKHIGPESTLELIGVKISFLETDHGLPCLAMKFESGEKSWVYGADGGTKTDYVPFIRKADLFLCEGTYRKEAPVDRPPGHLSNVEAAHIATEGECKHLVLTHLYPEYNAESYLAEARPFYDGELSMAKIGAQYII